MQTENKPLPGRIRFGSFEVEVSSHELLRAGHRIRLQEKSFLVLKVLVERPGQVVTREELAAALWPKDYFVDAEHGLNTAVRRLREVLGDSADEPRYIETLPRIGYRFVAPVEERRAIPDPDAASSPPVASPEEAVVTKEAATEVRPRRRFRVAALAVTAAVGLLAAIVAISRPSRTAEARTDAPGKSNQVEELLARARYLRNQKRAPEAKPFIEEALRLDPQNPEALSGLAMTYMVDGDVERARETARRALELDPRKAWESYRILGLLAVRVGDLAGAELQFRRSVEANPLDSKARNRLARHFLNCGRAAEAREQMLESRRLAPDDPDVQNIWIHYALLNGDYEDAIRQGEIWMAIWEKNYLADTVAAVRYELGLANVGARRAAEAIEHFRAAGRGDDAYVALAIGYTGRRAEARELLLAGTGPGPPGLPDTDREATAMAWTAIGDLDRAYAEIDRLIAARDYPSWLHLPLFDALRRDSRWPALIGQLEREFLSGVERLPPSQPDGMQAWPMRRRTYPAQESAPAR